jgi:hypothetical protein
MVHDASLTTWVSEFLGIKIYSRFLQPAQPSADCLPDIDAGAAVAEPPDF